MRSSSPQTTSLSASGCGNGNQPPVDLRQKEGSKRVPRARQRTKVGRPRATAKAKVAKCQACAQSTKVRM
eukprot:5433389-Karenia_brevis.AAC.1